MADGKEDRRQAIESLLSERKKYETWLAQLEMRRKAAPSHVFDRVHRDYRERLDAVGEKLAAETGAIEDIVRDLERRLADEQQALVARSDERAEAELRAAVGEFSDKEWATRRRKLDDAIAELRRKFDDTERELAAFRELLGSASGASAPARPSLEQAAVARVTGDLAIAGSEPPREPDGAPRGEAEAEPASDADAAALEGVGVVEEVVTVDETVAIEEVVTVEDASAIGDAALAESAHDTGVVDSPSPLSPPPHDDAEANADDGSGAAKSGVTEAASEEAPAPEFDELAFLRSVAGTPSSPRGSRAVGGGAARPGKRDERGSAKGAAPAPPELPDLTPPGPSPLGAPTPRTSQAVRSLKCQECGTLNFPTEWYCERCGGELAAF